MLPLEEFCSESLESDCCCQTRKRFKQLRTTINVCLADSNETVPEHVQHSQAHKSIR